MDHSRNRNGASGHGARTLIAMGALALALALLTPTDPSTQGTLAAAQPVPAESLQALWRSGEGKALDWGVVDVFGLNPTQPEAWVFVEDSTIDGNGVEFWLLHDTFVPPSPQNDDRTLRYKYISGFSPQTLQECIDYIVATYPHVTGPGDLTIHKLTATTVP